MRFGGCGGSRNGHRDKSFDQPNGQPSARHNLARGHERRSQRGDSHGHAAPARHCGEFRRTFHRLADIAEMLGSASVDGDGLATWRTERAWSCHGLMLPAISESVKYFVSQSTAEKTYFLR